MKTLLTIAATATLAFSSCKTTTDSIENSIDNKTFNLSTLNGTPLNVDANNPAIISFSGNRVNATVGCNQIFAEYKTDKNGKIMLSMGGATKMLCPDEMREDEFIAAFNSIASYTMTAEEVSFLDKDGKVLFTATKQ